VFFKKIDFDPYPEMDPEPDPEPELSEKSDLEAELDPEIIFSAPTNCFKEMFLKQIPIDFRFAVLCEKIYIDQSL